VNWATHVDMKTGRPQVVAKYSTRQNGADVNTKGICPAALGTKDQQPASFNPKTKPLLRADEPRLHGLRAVQGRVHRGPAVCRRHAVDVPGAGQPWRHGQLHHLGSGQGQDRLSKPEKFSVWSARWPPRVATLLRHARRLPEVRRSDDIKKELYKFKTPSGIIGNVNTWEFKGKQYIGVSVGHRWLGRHRHGRRSREGPDGLGAVGGYKELRQYTELGGWHPNFRSAANS
jgi:hypothetical protein